jgi:hypothetical protein
MDKLYKPNQTKPNSLFRSVKPRLTLISFRDIHTVFL